MYGTFKSNKQKNLLILSVAVTDENSRIRIRNTGLNLNFPSICVLFFADFEKFLIVIPALYTVCQDLSLKSRVRFHIHEQVVRENCIDVFAFVSSY
jgi:hypothetical protein